ncbi:hypothetical protein C8R43DRAFT_1114276 [Mycena crocata]|nr:hypothetical protein C8R43DRAFT_1114276 [Mycena crocata]
MSSKKAATHVNIPLFLALSATVVASIFNLLVLVDPVYLRAAQFAVLYVKPSNATDGPTLFMGLLGSCHRPNDTAQYNCTRLSFTPTYNTSLLPDNPARPLLSPPPSTAGAPLFFILSLVSSIFFVIAFLAMAKGWVKSPIIKILTCSTGIFACMFTVCGFLITSQWFNKTAIDFNLINGADGLLVAVTGEAFTMGWISIVLGALAVILSTITRVRKKDLKKNLQKPAGHGAGVVINNYV